MTDESSHNALEIDLMPYDGTDIWIVTLSGPIGVSTYEKLDETLAGLFEEEQFRLVVDMQNVSYVSSAGAGVLINAMTQCKDRGGMLVLANVTPNVWEVLELLQLESVLPVATSLPAAVSACSAAAVQA
jgi:anti-anti-sigma factor